MPDPHSLLRAGMTMLALAFAAATHAQPLPAAATGLPELHRLQALMGRLAGADAPTRVAALDRDPLLQRGTQQSLSRTPPPVLHAATQGGRRPIKRAGVTFAGSQEEFREKSANPPELKRRLG